MSSDPVIIQWKEILATLESGLAFHNQVDKEQVKAIAELYRVFAK